MPRKTSRELRRTALMRALHLAGRSLSTEEIHAEQREWRDRVPSIKTTLRDLRSLQDDDQVIGTKPKGQKSYYWSLHNVGLDLVLKPAESVTLIAILQHAERFGFKLVTEQMVRLRNYAQGVINRNATQDLVAQGRITSGTRFMTLLPGAYSPAHLEIIQTEMLKGRNLKVVYLPRDAEGGKCTYVLKPLALSFQDSNIYLSAHVFSEEWPEGKEPAPDKPRGKYSSNGPGKACVLMLHRVVSVRTDFLEIPGPEHYDFKSFKVQKDLMTVHSEEAINLRLRLEPNLLNRLTENRISETQEIEPTESGAILKCSIQDTQGLRLFLLSNADEIEVLDPGYLREHIRNTLRKALSMYGDLA
ncbi:helix-turn-helix transcriptional regulator [Pseudomonas soli]|uniref:helix-turn-helix transcriptional regulator n=1 Tax=Pseudomonas soli TaxID=1306993 RepID=UPI0029B955D9|nr:WYL domain-containing protein [Pseudomonas soli]